ncbi:MAG: formylglycine-generating enzyme family protein [Planctomycetes bacterium]|nr:formylglycine-generating enzyme family protein [Planctomycetota bacterium]MCC7171096.1 formylglycine-generating enzyme family protein [Planctomycetota bacterium]
MGDADDRGWRAAKKRADLVIELAKGVEMLFQRIPAGEFVMGSRGNDSYGESRNLEEPRHRVVLTHEFWLGTFPVTQREFAVWSRAARKRHEFGFQNRDWNPAENLTWDEGTAFCDWITKSVKAMPKGWAARLPSEAQWEYACRAGSTTDYSNGDGEAALSSVGWWSGNSGHSTHPVGALAANAFGLHDMHGNVWEWCLDAWNGSAYRQRQDGVIDPEETAPASQSDPNRVMRGGSWNDSAGDCRSAIRDWRGPSNRRTFLGFRVCLLPGPVVNNPSRGATQRAKAAVGGGKGGIKPTDRPPKAAGAAKKTERGSEAPSKTKRKAKS